MKKREPEPWAPQDEIEKVRALKHRVDGRYSCKCEECRAISQVCALAQEAIAMKAAHRLTPKEAQEVLSWMEPGLYPRSLEIATKKLMAVADRASVS